MKTEKYPKSIYVLITFGILFTIICTILSILNPAAKSANVLNIIFMLVQAAMGLSVIIIAKKVTLKFVHLFLGLLYLCWSIILFLTEVILPFTIKQMWPVFGFTAGVLWCIAGYRKYKEPKFGYLIPSVSLIAMGIWYSLFSFGIIKLSFRTVAYTVGPFFLVSVAIFLVVFFLLQQRYKELVFSDEETGEFSDEEASFISESEMEEDD